jgi:hypothetical protein
LIPIVEQDADLEAIASDALKTFQTGKILGTQRCRCLSFNGEKVAPGVFSCFIEINPGDS